MTCENLRAILDDYMDGLLAEGQVVRLTEHVSTCTACRRDMDAVEALRKHVGALPTEILPGRDLWTRIESGLASASFARPVTRAGRCTKRWGLLISAAAVLLIGIGGFLARFSLEGSWPGAGTRSEAVGGLDREVREAEAEYARAREELAASLVRHSDALEPGTRLVIQQNLAVIDNALAEIRATLTRDPENVHLIRMLAGVQGQSLNLIRLAVRLSTET